MLTHLVRFFQRPDALQRKINKETKEAGKLYQRRTPPPTHLCGHCDQLLFEPIHPSLPQTRVGGDTTYFCTPRCWGLWCDGFNRSVSAPQNVVTITRPPTCDRLEIPADIASVVIHSRETLVVGSAPLTTSTHIITCVQMAQSL